MNNTLSTPMHVQAEAVTRAIRLLTAAGCKFAIVDAAGQKHGDLEVAEPVAHKKRAASRFGVGAFKNYYAPLVAAIAPGSCAVVPYGPFDIDKAARDALRASLCSHCSDTWGNGSYISHMNERGIEVLRME